MSLALLFLPLSGSLTEAAPLTHSFLTLRLDDQHLMKHHITKHNTEYCIWYYYVNVLSPLVTLEHIVHV